MNSPHAVQQTHQRRGGVFAFITILARTCGLITFAGLGLLSFAEWSKAGPSDSRIPIVLSTVIVGYLELLWIFDKFLTCCICCFRSERCFFWICCVPIDNWVKTLLYTALSLSIAIPLWLRSIYRTDIHVVGALLITTGLCYLLRTFKYRTMPTDEDEAEMKSGR